MPDTELFEVGRSIAETADELGITTDEVRAASRYFRHHREEITEEWRRRQEAYEGLLRSGSEPE
jgi:DNA-directed RNA polymerase specialized sigma24 family protein